MKSPPRTNEERSRETGISSATKTKGGNAGVDSQPPVTLAKS